MHLFIWHLLCFYYFFCIFSIAITTIIYLSLRSLSLELIIAFSFRNNVIGRLFFIQHSRKRIFEYWFWVTENIFFSINTSHQEVKFFKNGSWFKSCFLQYTLQNSLLCLNLLVSFKQFAMVIQNDGPICFLFFFLSFLSLTLPQQLSERIFGLQLQWSITRLTLIWKYLRNCFTLTLPAEATLVWLWEREKSCECVLRDKLASVLLVSAWICVSSVYGLWNFRCSLIEAITNLQHQQLPLDGAGGL